MKKTFLLDFFYNLYLSWTSFYRLYYTYLHTFNNIIINFKILFKKVFQ